MWSVVFYLKLFIPIQNSRCVITNKPTPFSFPLIFTCHVLAIAILYILTILLFPMFCLFQIPFKYTSPDFHFKNQYTFSPPQKESYEVWSHPGWLPSTYPLGLPAVGRQHPSCCIPSKLHECLWEMAISVVVNSVPRRRNFCERRRVGAGRSWGGFFSGGFQTSPFFLLKK